MLGGLGGDRWPGRGQIGRCHEERPLHTALVVLKTWAKVWPRCQGEMGADRGTQGLG